MTSRVQYGVRSTQHHQGNLSTAGRSAVTAMCAGLAMTVVATIALHLDHATTNALASHLRSGYPTYTQARVDAAATTYLVYLSVIGVLGVAGWLSSIYAVVTCKRWARAAATTLFVLGTSVALTDLLIRDTSGDTGLPALLGWVGVLPCLPGLLAVSVLWRRQ